MRTEKKGGDAGGRGNRNGDQRTYERRRRERERIKRKHKFAGDRKGKCREIEAGTKHAVLRENLWTSDRQPHERSE